MPSESRDQKPAPPDRPASRVSAADAQVSGIGRRRAAAKDEGSSAYHERREEIKRAAGQLFKRHGFRGTSMGQVA